MLFKHSAVPLLACVIGSALAAPHAILVARENGYAVTSNTDINSASINNTTETVPLPSTTLSAPTPAGPSNGIIVNGFINGSSSTVTENGNSSGTVNVNVNDNNSSSSNSTSIDINTITAGINNSANTVTVTITLEPTAAVQTSTGDVDQHGSVVSGVTKTTAPVIQSTISATGSACTESVIDAGATGVSSAPVNSGSPTLTAIISPTNATSNAGLASATSVVGDNNTDKAGTVSGVTYYSRFMKKRNWWGA